MRTKKITTIILSGLLSLLLMLSVFVLLSPTTASAKTDDESKLSFTRISTGYSVKLLDKTATKIIIPRTYLDLPVTEIQANGFMGAPNLQKVVVPYTVTNVNNMAFNNCPNLERVHFQTGRDENDKIIGVQSIGQLSFGKCPKLSKIILPTSVIPANVNAAAFMNNNNTKVVYRGEGNLTLALGATAVTDPYSIEYTETVTETGMHIAIESYQSIADSEIEERIIDNQWFADNNSYGMFTYEICDFAFANDKAKKLYFHEEVVQSSESIFLWSNAFSDTVFEEITLPSNVIFEDTIYNIFGVSTGIFAQSEDTLPSQLKKINFAGSINKIPDYMFENCVELEEICFMGDKNIIPETVTSIGKRAFANCNKLDFITIPATDPIQVIGESAFEGWVDYADDKQSIIVGYDNVPESWTEANWLGYDNEEPHVISQNPYFKITLNVNNSNSEIGTYPLKVLANTSFADLKLNPDYKEPTSLSHNFLYWKDSFGSVITDNYKFNQNTEIFAEWKLKEYLLDFEENVYVNFNVTELDGVFKGTDNKYYITHGGRLTFSVKAKAEYDRSISPIIIYVDGDIIAPNGSAYIVQNIINKKHITVEPMKINKYTIKLDKQGGSGGSDSAIATYKETMPLGYLPPSKTGNAFQGYYENPNGGGIRYYDKDMKGINAWIKLEDGTIFAHYTPNNYNLTFKDSVTGHNSSVSVKYGSTITLPTISRTRYNGFWIIDGIKYSMGVSYTYSNPNDITGTASWEGYKYTISFNNINYGNSYFGKIYVSGKEVKSYEYEYGVGLNLSTVGASLSNNNGGYFYFKGWYSNMLFTNKIEAISSTQFDTVNLYAKWEFKNALTFNTKYGNALAYQLITDKGIFNNPYDGYNDKPGDGPYCVGNSQSWLNYSSLNYNTWYDYGYSANGNYPTLKQMLKAMGFTKFEIALEFSIYEEDDGYQHIYIYNSKETNAKLLWSTDIEHGPGKKDTMQKSYYYTLTFSIDDLSEHLDLCIRYNASGTFADDFRIKLIGTTSLFY